MLTYSPQNIMISEEWGIKAESHEEQENVIQYTYTVQNVYAPQSLNRYAFEKNNPYKSKDPTGHYQYQDANGKGNYALTPAEEINNANMGLTVQPYSAPVGSSGIMAAGAIANDANQFLWYQSVTDSSNNKQLYSIYYQQHSEAGVYNTRISLQYGGTVVQPKFPTAVLNTWYTNYGSINKNTNILPSVVESPTVKSRKNGSTKSGYYINTGGITKYTINENSKGEVTGGSIGDISMSAGFAAKAKQALEDLKNGKI